MKATSLASEKKKNEQSNIWHSSIDCVACLVLGCDCDVMMRKYSIFNFLIWNLGNHHGNSNTVLQEYFLGLTTNKSFITIILASKTCYEPGSSSETSYFGFCLVQGLELKQKHSGDSRFTWFTRFVEDLLDLQKIY